MKIERITGASPTIRLSHREDQSRIEQFAPLHIAALEPNGERDAGIEDEPENPSSGHAMPSIILDSASAGESLDAEGTLEKWLDRIRHAHRLDLRL